MFIPPLNMGQFQPSPATMSQWIYQIWQFLQENPIATKTEIREFIQSELTQYDTLANAIEDYLTENPPTAPVQSVQGKTGAVQLAYNEIVPASNAVPVYKASSTPGTNTLTGQYNVGYRLFVNTTTQEIFTISPAGALSLVGRGKFDGTTVDLDSSKGDTTISEALTEISGAVTNLETLSRSQITNSQYTFLTNEIIKRGNVVTLAFRILKNDDNNYELIGTIPEGFRPPVTLGIRALSDSLGGCPIFIESTGQIVTTTADTTFGEIRVVLTYVV